jgi:hypothetical protein
MMDATMRTGFSSQYNTCYVKATEGCEAEAVIDKCEEVGAVFEEYGDRYFVVSIRDDVGPELWTRSALERSLRTAKDQPKSDTARRDQ